MVWISWNVFLSLSMNALTGTDLDQGVCKASTRACEKFLLPALYLESQMHDKKKRAKQNNPGAVCLSKGREIIPCSSSSLHDFAITHLKIIRKGKNKGSALPTRLPDRLQIPASFPRVRWTCTAPRYGLFVTSCEANKMWLCVPSML